MTNNDLAGRLRREFLPAILHGDEEHRVWLAAAVDAFITGEPVPPPTGKGSKEARLSALSADNKALREILQEFADDLEVEIRHRWGTDVRLAHKLKRDLEPIERVRALLTTKEPQS